MRRVAFDSLAFTVLTERDYPRGPSAARGQGDAEKGAGASVAARACRDPSPMLLDDPLDHREAEAHAPLLLREIGVEETREVGLGNPGSLVFDGEDETAAGLLDPALGGEMHAQEAAVSS